MPRASADKSCLGSGTYGRAPEAAGGRAGRNADCASVSPLERRGARFRLLKVVCQKPLNALTIFPYHALALPARECSADTASPGSPELLQLPQMDLPVRLIAQTLPLVAC